MDWLSVAEAAELLQISQTRVRSLATDGQLGAVRHSAGWLIDRRAVEDRLRRAVPTGRPVGAGACWLILDILSRANEEISGHISDRPASMRMPAAGQTSPGSGDALLQYLLKNASTDAAADRHLRHRVGLMLADPPPVATWNTWLARRATTQRMHAHPGVLERLGSDRRLSRTGAWALAMAGGDVTPGPQVDAYVADAEASDVVNDYRLVANRAGNVSLRVLGHSIPSPSAVVPGRAVPPPVAAVDLLDADDVRPRQLAADWLQRWADLIATPSDQSDQPSTGGPRRFSARDAE
jgi:excisionase family DNA binding protein